MGEIHDSVLAKGHGSIQNTVLGEPGKFQASFGFAFSPPAPRPTCGTGQRGRTPHAISTKIPVHSPKARHQNHPMERWIPFPLHKLKKVHFFYQEIELTVKTRWACFSASMPNKLLGGQAGCKDIKCSVCALALCVEVGRGRALNIPLIMFMDLGGSWLPTEQEIRPLGGAWTLQFPGRCSLRTEPHSCSVLCGFPRLSKLRAPRTCCFSFPVAHLAAPPSPALNVEQVCGG